MALFIVTIAWVVFLFYFLFRVSRLYLSRELLTVKEASHMEDLPSLTVIVPARNEESNIKRCVISLSNQTYPDNRYKIIVVDDNSSDSTPYIVKQLQEKLGNLELVEAGELPDGWSGKNHACWTGVQKSDSQWYCFVDADVSAEPELLETAVDMAVHKEIDMLSINPFQEILSFSERFFLPGVFVSIALSMDFKRVNDPSRPEALANGQFILMRRRAYEAIQGHYAVRNEIMEDLALAKIIKQKGYRLYWIFSDELIRTRMYRNVSQIWEGFSKNLVDIMKNTGTIGSIFTSLKSVLLGWMPLVLLILTWLHLRSGHDPFLIHFAFISAVIVAAVMYLFMLLIVKALGIPSFYVLSFPFGFTMHAALTINSLIRRKKGDRKWKGRTYRQ